MVVALAVCVEESGSAMPLFNIKCNNGTTVSVEAELTCKVLDFKELISPKVDVAASSGSSTLARCSDPETLESYNLKEGHTVHMVKGAAPRQPLRRPRPCPHRRRQPAPPPAPTRRPTRWRT